jgi:WD40 repeat protein
MKDAMTARDKQTRQVTLLPDNIHAISESMPGMGATLWRIDTGQVEGKLRLAFLRSVTYSKDGATEVATTFDGAKGSQLRKVSVKDGSTLWTSTDFYQASAANFSPDEKLVSVVVDNSKDYRKPDLHFAIVDAGTGKTLRTAPTADFARSTQFSPDGATVLVVGQSGLRLFRTSDLSPVAEMDHASDHIAAVAFSPNSRLVAIARNDKDIQVLDATTLRLLVTLIPFEGGDWVAYTPTGAATGSPGGLARLYTVDNQGAHPIPGPIRPEEIKQVLSAP